MPRIFLAARAVLSAALVSAAGSVAAESCNPPVPPTGSGGAWFERYQAWCARCGGRPSADASPARCTPGPDWGRASGGGGVYGGASGAELGRQIGGVLGEMLREGLFGNPQQDQARQAALQAQRQREEEERQRLANERARQDEQRYQRLSASLLDFKPAPQLSLLGGQPGSGGLQLILGDDAERSMNPALAELARAAAWSTLAARAATAEDAVLLADAAFQSLIGGKVNLPPPPADVKGVPVHPMLPEVEPLKKQYLGLQPRVPNAMKPVLDAEHRRATFQRLEAEALAMERTAAQADRRAKAREAAREARELREKAETELRLARTDFERQQLAVNALEQSLRAWLSSFAAGERKPDSYYYLGFEDGSQCFSQNAGPRCDKARAPAAQFEACLASYRLGYSAGDKLRKDLLEHAYQWGSRDGGTGVYEITDQRANGPCRYDFVMAYNRGYFGTSIGPVASAPSAARTDAAAQPAPARGPRDEARRVIEGISALAKRMEWTEKEQERLEKALNGLDLNTSDTYKPAQIRKSWTDVLARSSNAEYARDAARGEGPGLYGAGTQVSGKDCAIFAVATAAGEPYGVVSTRATQLIRDGEWRNAAERADPQAVIMKSGLKGGEVVMLAEAFGQAEIVEPSKFAVTLKAGRPILVNVVPRDGDIDAGHQLVLSKTFQRGAETWYEVIDSNSGPMRRLYMSHAELNLLVHENGVAFQPEPGGRPELLRARGARQ